MIVRLLLQILSVFKSISTQIGTILAQSGDLKKHIDSRFDAQDRKFDALDQKLGAQDAKLERILDAVEAGPATQIEVSLGEPEPKL